MPSTTAQCVVYDVLLFLPARPLQQLHAGAKRGGDAVAQRMVRAQPQTFFLSGTQFIALTDAIACDNRLTHDR